VLHFYRSKRKVRVEPITIFFIVFVILFLGSVSYLGFYYYQGNKNRKKQEDLNNLIDNILDEDKDKDKGDKKDRYESIRDEYPYIVGRVKLNYYSKEKVLPVMQTKDDPEYFLYRDAKGKDSKWGTVFLDYRADIKKPSTNLILYGHSMEDLSMFGGLSVYKKEEYYKKYPTVKFETMYEKEAKYEIFATMNAKIYDINNSSKEFEYYNFIEAKNEEDFNNFVQNVKKMQCFDTGITPKYGDEILTLSTCDKSLYGDNGRFVVLAKKAK